MFLGGGLILFWFHWSRPPPCDKVHYEPCRQRDFIDELLSTEPLK
jgi:hypothetical protein